MSLAEPSLYTRVNLFFSDEFIADYIPEWKSLRKVFGENGNVILLTEEQGDFCKEKMLAIKEEHDQFRQSLRILEFLSYLREFDSQAVEKGIEPPPYIVEALTYIDEHYPERIVAHELAWHLGIGRTTLMTAFRRYTGSTLSEYVLRLRVKKAIVLLRQGSSQEQVVEQVGLCNGSGLIRAFRHCYGMTPKQYIKQYPSKKKTN
jgi:AraC-like DNA-binding protein